MPAYLREIASEHAPARSSSEGGDATAPGEKANSGFSPLAGSALTPARAQLASAQREVASASAALEKAQVPIERLSRLIADHEARERRLAELRAADEQARITRLLSGSTDPLSGDGSTTEVPCAWNELERELQAGSANVAAAKKALDSLQPEYARAADRVRQAHRHRDGCVYAAAVAASRSYIALQFVPAIQRCLEIEATLRSVETALRTRGASEPVSTAALAAAATLAEEITRVRREATKMTDLAPGKRLLEQLMTDPRAELG